MCFPILLLLAVAKLGNKSIFYMRRTRGRLEKEKEYIEMGRAQKINMSFAPSPETVKAVLLKVTKNDFTFSK